MIIKTSQLQGTALDWAVAKCEGNNARLYPHEGLVIHNLIGWFHYRPSTDWAQGGPIIEREGIHIGRKSGYWVSQLIGSVDQCYEVSYMEAQAPLIAAMRCYVASKLGDEIEIPEEVCQPQ